MLSGVPTSQGMLAAPKAGGSKEQILELQRDGSQAILFTDIWPPELRKDFGCFSQGAFTVISYSGHRK